MNQATAKPAEIAQRPALDLESAIPIFVLAGSIPWIRAGFAEWRTPLRSAVMWAWAAWLSWTVLAFQEAAGEGTATLRLITLALSACAGMAVLGARRPGAAAWNFVVAGLLLVLLLHIAQRFGQKRLEGIHLIFLVGLLLLSFANYLPTRLGPAAILALLAISKTLGFIAKSNALESPYSAQEFLLIGFVPWVAWLGLAARSRSLSQFDREWLSFRDRFGLFWALRMRDQFNRAATNAGWPVTLSWNGLRRQGDGANLNEAELLATLQALLKRFGVKESSDQ